MRQSWTTRQSQKCVLVASGLPHRDIDYEYYSLLTNCGGALIINNYRRFAMNLEEAIGKELRYLRVQKQMSQQELAFAADVHRTYVSLIERGLKSPTLNVLVRLCEALEMSPEKFVKQVIVRAKRQRV